MQAGRLCAATGRRAEWELSFVRPPVPLPPLPFRGLPLALAQWPLDRTVRRVLRRHPHLLARLGWQEARVVLIEPDDMPVAFALHCSRRGARLRLLVRGTPVTACARIRGPFLDLFDLLTGEDDGDAQFFSRRLRFEGDTEVVLALRNAIDDAELDPLADFLPLPPPLTARLRAGLERAARLANGAARDLARIERLLVHVAAGREEEAR